MPKFDGNVTKVDLNRDKLAEASHLAEDLYTCIRLMSHGREYAANKQEAKEKCAALSYLLGGM